MWRKKGREKSGKKLGAEEGLAKGNARGRGGKKGRGKALGELRPEQRLVGGSGGSHLARLLVHVEGADDALGDLAAGALHQVLGQPVGQVGLARAAGAREDEAPVLQQEAYVVLHHRLGDQRLEHQAVDALLLQT